MREDLIKGVRVLSNKIFVELDQGEKVTAGGIIRPDDDMKDWGIHPREALVLAVGPKARESGVEPGMKVVLPHGSWSRKVMETKDVDGVNRKVWMTDTDQVIVAFED